MKVLSSTSSSPAWRSGNRRLFSRSVISDSSQLHVPQHINLACSSPSPRVCLNSCILSWWCIQPFYPLSFSSPHGFNLSSISLFFNQFSHSVQFNSVTQSCPTLWESMDCSTPGIRVHHQLPEFTQTHVHWVSDTLQPLSSPSVPTFNLSQHQGLFKWVSSLHQVAKYWSFSFNISPSNEYSGLISFRISWFDLL